LRQSFCGPVRNNPDANSEDGLMRVQDVLESVNSEDGLMRVQDAVEGASANGVAWPVVVIGGVVIVGGLIAVRNEFGNWRQRKAERSRRG